MRTTQQRVGREEPNNIGSPSKSGKPVLIKKRSSKSSKVFNAGEDAFMGVDSSGHSASSVDDLDAQIARRAYELYRQRGGCHGEDQADWFEAEREILSESY